MPGKRGSPPNRVPRRTFLREWRLYRGMTVEQVGKLIGRDHSTLTRVETGAAAYTQHTLEQLADVYRCSVADLLTRDPSKPDVAGEVASLVSAASPEMQGRARDVLSALLKRP